MRPAADATSVERTSLRFAPRLRQEVRRQCRDTRDRLSVSNLARFSQARAAGFPTYLFVSYARREGRRGHLRDDVTAGNSCGCVAPASCRQRAVPA